MHSCNVGDLISLQRGTTARRAKGFDSDLTGRSFPTRQIRKPGRPASRRGSGDSDRAVTQSSVDFEVQGHDRLFARLAQHGLLPADDGHGLSALFDEPFVDQCCDAPLVAMSQPPSPSVILVVAASALVRRNFDSDQIAQARGWGNFADVDTDARHVPAALARRRRDGRGLHGTAKDYQ